MRPTFPTQMSDAEAVMWRMEHDPYLSSTFANVTLLDRPVDVEALRRRMNQAVLAIPRLRQHVRPAPGNLSPPAWREDPDFDLDRHLRHVVLPAPGTLRELLDLTALIAADPFDRTRPLWQFVVVDGLADGRGALIQKMHHSLADGEASLAISMQYLDLERRPAPRPDPRPVEVAPATEAPSTEPAPGIRALALSSVRLPLGLIQQVRELLASPQRIPAAAGAAIEAVRGAVRNVGDTEPAHSPLWTKRSLRRRVETTRTALEPLRAAAKRHGGTVNMALLTAAAQAAGAYHDALGAPVDTLRASMAVSTRIETSGTNAFTLARFIVPTAPMPIDERFAAIAAATTAARSATAPLDLLGAVAATLPTSLLCRVARQQTQTVDFATSNVRAAAMPLYIGGAKILANCPIGPLLGVAFNLTMMSYAGTVDFGMNIDPAAVTDPALLVSCLDAALADLAGEAPAKKKPGKKAPAKKAATTRPRRPREQEGSSPSRPNRSPGTKAPKARSTGNARRATRR